VSSRRHCDGRQLRHPRRKCAGPATLERADRYFELRDEDEIAPALVDDACWSIRKVVGVSVTAKRRAIVPLADTHALHVGELSPAKDQEPVTALAAHGAHPSV
jgi:hypothetical protein